LKSCHLTRLALRLQRGHFLLTRGIFALKYESGGTCAACLNPKIHPLLSDRRRPKATRERHPG
jgi:hypothetical protein